MAAVPRYGTNCVKSHPLRLSYRRHAVTPVMGMTGTNMCVFCSNLTASASIRWLLGCTSKWWANKGLRDATPLTAILNAKTTLQTPLKIITHTLPGKNGTVAHECIIDIPHWKQNQAISEEDTQNVWLDFGFHRANHVFPCGWHTDDRTNWIWENLDWVRSLLWTPWLRFAKGRSASCKQGRNGR